MIAGKKVLGVIPARGGSKRVPRKNLREVAGRPLIAWTIEQARASRYLDRLIVSTEDEQIAALARESGAEVPFLRPPELAADATPGIDPILHALEQLPGYNYVVVLQPTSPMRSSEDIDGAIAHCAASDAPSCVSVTPRRHSPHGVFMVADGRLRRASQDADPRTLYVLNGAVYVARIDWLRKHRTFVGEETLAYVMPPERSLDIDTEDDLARFAAAVAR